jgi:DNA (cytosine-5)-methyltransferase 1
MVDIAAIPWNGLTVASLFSGCGGSCLGFRMAGYRIVYANEFIPAARDTYRANSPDTPIDSADVRQVTVKSLLDRAETALKAAGATEIDVLEGSPPCASFSTAGKREAGWGRIKAYSETKQRTDDLFFEYARILAELRPRVFVAENVSGLVKGTAKGYFLDIFERLQSCGYRVACRALDAQWLGVPQMRKRVIFIGVRNDLNRSPVFPLPLPYRYSVRDALPWIIAHEYMGPGHTNRFAPGSVPAYAVSQAGNFSKKHAEYTQVFVDTKKGPRSLDEPAPTVQTHGNRGTESELTLQSIVALRNGNKAPYDAKGKTLSIDEPLPTVMGGDTLGCAPFQFEIEEETNIARFAIGPEWDKMRVGGKSDKYFSLVRPRLDRPCNTLTCGNASSGIAGVVHPTEKRRFSIAELKRICAFPDDFILTGTYAQQWERLGRAVPPLMMRAVAETVRDKILCPQQIR